MTFLSSLVASALAAIQTPTVPAGPLSLEDALGVATRNAFSIQISQSNLEKSSQRIAQARAGLGPRLTVGGTYTRYEKESTTSFGGQTFVTQGIDSKQVTASVTLPIDISGNLGRSVRAAQQQRAAAQNTLAATINDVRLNTKQAFYAVLRNEALVKVAQQAATDAEERFKQAKQLFSQDQIAKVDVERFETQLAQSNADLIAARNGLKLAQNQFNFVLARPIDSEVQLKEVKDLPEVSGTDMDLVAAGQANRPEVKSLMASIDALGLSRRALEAGNNPSLSAAINHVRNIDPAGSAARQSTVGTLTLSFPIFDSGLTRARVREAQQDELQARVNLEQLKLGISQDVRNAMANLQSAKARLQNADAQVGLASEVYRLAKVKQDAGTGTYVEVIDAETTLTQARNQQVAARFDYLTAYAQLQRAVGSDSLLNRGGK